MTEHAAVFLDTAYVFALVNTHDQWHARAKQWQEVLTADRRPLLTHEFVLTEIGDGLAAVGAGALTAMFSRSGP